MADHGVPRPASDAALADSRRLVRNANETLREMRLLVSASTATIRKSRHSISRLNHLIADCTARATSHRS